MNCALIPLLMISMGASPKQFNWKRTSPPRAVAAQVLVSGPGKVGGPILVGGSRPTAMTWNTVTMTWNGVTMTWH
jgi:hypothetical protein